MTFNGWFFLAIFVAADAFVVSQGVDGYFWSYKTPTEIQVQAKK